MLGVCKQDFMDYGTIFHSPNPQAKNSILETDNSEISTSNKADVEKCMNISNFSENMPTPGKLFVRRHKKATTSIVSNYELRDRQSITNSTPKIKQVKKCRRLDQTDKVKKTKKGKADGKINFEPEIEILNSDSLSTPDDSQFSILNAILHGNRETPEETQFRQQAYPRFVDTYKKMETIFGPNESLDTNEEKLIKYMGKENDRLEEKWMDSQLELIELEQNLLIKKSTFQIANQNFESNYQNLASSALQFRTCDHLASTSSEYAQFLKKWNQEYEQDPRKFYVEKEGKRRDNAELQKDLKVIRSYPTMSYAEKLGQQQNHMVVFPPKVYAPTSSSTNFMNIQAD